MTSFNKVDRKLIILSVSHLASGSFKYVGEKVKIFHITFFSYYYYTAWDKYFIHGFSTWHSMTVNKKFNDIL